MQLNRNKLLTIIGLLFGLFFLYFELNKFFNNSDTFSQIDILLKGIAFILLCISTILMSVAFENRIYVNIISSIGLLIGIVFLIFPVSQVFRSSSFHLLFCFSIPFAISTKSNRITTIISILCIILGTFFLYLNPLLDLDIPTLHILLPGMILFCIIFTKIAWCERLSIGLIVLGLISLCQPFLILFYQTGFQLLLVGLTGFIVVAHR